MAKLDWYRAGNEASERQWDDVRRLVRLNRANLDWSYLETDEWHEWSTAFLRVIGAIGGSILGTEYGSTRCVNRGSL